MHVTDVHEQILEKHSIHHLIYIFGMRPDEYDGVFGTVRDGLKAMRNPGLDFVLVIFRGPDALGHGPAFDSCDFALEDFEGF